MSSSPSNIKISPEINGLYISWNITDATGLGTQYLYIKNKLLPNWGEPVVLSSKVRNYKATGLLFGIEYEIRIEAFNYTGSDTSYGVPLGAEPENLVLPNIEMEII